MFTRNDLKQRAKDVLKKNYWTALALVALIYLAEMVLALGIFALTFPTMLFASLSGYHYTPVNDVISVISYIFSIVVSLFLMPLNVGFFRSLIKMSNGESSEIKDIIWGYKNNFGNTISTYIRYFVIVFLLSLIASAAAVFGLWLPTYIITYFEIGMIYDLQAFIVSLSGILFMFIGMIPALIKSYDYYLAGFILAEETDLTGKEVLKRSKALMKGHRFFTFKLDLSFIGWAFLGLICCCGLGMIFVTPYIYQTQTELYLELTGRKKDAVYDVEFKETSEPEKEENTEEENF